ncbi:MAG TPA: response regulator [Myxococcaceae bacterium]|nr:response regulator [Myxococcaceae bacterium]
MDGRNVVLLAEDDPDQREILLEVLAFEGYQVISADGPAQVLQRLTQHPDVVLLDLCGTASPEVMQALASAVRKPKVLLVSADPKLADIAKELGADGFISKPYELDDLLRTLSSALEAATADERCWATAR